MIPLILRHVANFSSDEPSVKMPTEHECAGVVGHSEAVSNYFQGRWTFTFHRDSESVQSPRGSLTTPTASH